MPDLAIQPRLIGSRGAEIPYGANSELPQSVRELCARRGDFTAEEWQNALRRVLDVRQYHTADYLWGTPLLVDFPEEGLAQFGLSCEEFELGRM